MQLIVIFCKYNVSPKDILLYLRKTTDFFVQAVEHSGGGLGGIDPCILKLGI